MKYANQIADIINAFQPKPLEIKELGEFYFEGTMAERTGDPYDSPIQDIQDACKQISPSNVFLLLGHRGCGKSTELNHMSQHLETEHYPVRTIQCAADLDLTSPVYEDLLILMGDALLDIADKQECELDPELRELLKNYWNEVERDWTAIGSGALETGVKVEAKTPALLQVLRLSTTMKGILKYNEQRRTVYRQHISKRLSEWTQAMNQIADAITEKLEGKQPIIIFEDLDKLESGQAWGVFADHARTLSDFGFPVIYTFPIALSYDARYRALEGYFQSKTFPMIKVQTLEEKRNEAGFDTIMKILAKRADLDALFEPDVLDQMIEKTGGSLRDLFRAINAAGTRARRRRGKKVNMEDAKRALEGLRTDLTKMIDRRHYGFLAEIMDGNHEKIQDREMLLEMLLAGTVLEYNGKRWHNVHPLVKDFLREQRLMNTGSDDAAR